MAIAIKKADSKPAAKLSNAKYNEWMWGYLLVAPTIIGLITLKFNSCTLKTLILSFQKTGDFGAHTWAGLENYKRLLSDPAVWQATGNTLKYAIIVVSNYCCVIFNCCSVIKSKKLKEKVYIA